MHSYSLCFLNESSVSTRTSELFEKLVVQLYLEGRGGLKNCVGKWTGVFFSSCLLKLLFDWHTTLVMHLLTAEEGEGERSV